MDRAIFDGATTPTRHLSLYSGKRSKPALGNQTPLLRNVHVLVWRFQIWIAPDKRIQCKPRPKFIDPLDSHLPRVGACWKSELGELDLVCSSTNLIKLDGSSDDSSNKVDMKEAFEGEASPL